MREFRDKEQVSVFRVSLIELPEKICILIVKFRDFKGFKIKGYIFELSCHPVVKTTKSDEIGYLTL